MTHCFPAEGLVLINWHVVNSYYVPLRSVLSRASPQYIDSVRL